MTSFVRVCFCFFVSESDVVLRIRLRGILTPGDVERCRFTPVETCPPAAGPAPKNPSMPCCPPSSRSNPKKLRASCKSGHMSSQALYSIRYKLTLLIFIAGFPPDDRVIGSVTSSHNLLAYLAMYSVDRFLVKGKVVCRERCVSKAKQRGQPCTPMRMIFPGSQPHLAAFPKQDSWATSRLLSLWHRVIAHIVHRPGQPANDIRLLE